MDHINRELVSLLPIMIGMSYQGGSYQFRYTCNTCYNSNNVTNLVHMSEIILQKQIILCLCDML